MTPPRGDGRAVTLHDLIRERVGGQRFGLFFCVEEDEEESSGCVVTEDGRHFEFWTGCQNGRMVLAEWQEIEAYEVDKAGWLESAEYRDALAEVGRGEP